MIPSAVYYLPTIKNPLNVSLLAVELIHSPHIFPTPGSENPKPVDVPLISLIIDGFEASATRKSAVTDPTLSPKDWTSAIYRAFENLKPEHQWRAIAPLAGLIRSIHFQEEKFKNSEPHYGTGFGARNNKNYILADKTLSQSLNSAFIKMINNTLSVYGGSGALPQPGYPSNLQMSIAIFSLAVTLPFLNEKIANEVNYSDLVLPACHFIYQSPQGLDGGRSLRLLVQSEGNELGASLGRSPVLTKLNLLSGLLQKAIEETGRKTMIPVIHTLSIIYSFSESLANEWDDVTTLVPADKLRGNTSAWNFLKLSLFSVAAVFQGYTSLLLLGTQRHIFSKFAVIITSKIILTFSNLYFIVAQISLAGFPAFDAVYYSSLDILLHPRFECRVICDIIQDMAYPISSLNEMERNVKISQSLVFRGKIIFLLNITEAVVPFLPASSSTAANPKDLPINLYDDIIPLTDQFLTLPPTSPETPNLTITYFLPILESAHSVMLSIIATPGQIAQRLNGTENPFVLPSFLRFRGYAEEGFTPETPEPVTLSQLSNAIIPNYFDKVMSLFPAILSFNQFSLAITTLIKSLCPPSPLYALNPTGADYILNALIEQSDNTRSGISLPMQSGTHSVPDPTKDGPDLSKSSVAPPSGKAPPTVRSVLLSSVIHSLPNLDITNLKKYLVTVWKKIDDTQKKNDVINRMIYEEQRFLEIEMFNMISNELEQQKATVGIRWWYQRSSL